jgi:hypothetical protein
MNAIRIHRRIESETIHLPELRPMIGQDVEIIVLGEASRRPPNEADWEAFFASAGTDLVDPEIYKQQRQFDQAYGQPPPL